MKGLKLKGKSDGGNMKLNKFDIILWITSLLVVGLSYIFTSNDYLTLIASLIGVSALLFIAKGYVLGQILTIVFSILYGVISFYFKYYGELITYVFMTLPMAIVTLISWIKHPFKDTKEVEVNKLNKFQIILMIILSIVVTVVFYFVLKIFNTKNLIVSTISITTSFIAAYLSFFRSPYYAVGYCFNDIFLIILWILATIEKQSYFPMIVCFFMFLINDLYGFISWKKMQIRQINSK